MIYKSTVRKTGVVHYEIIQDISICTFFSLMHALEVLFERTCEFESIPEAEIARIRLSKGIIYGKLDLAYGLSFDCTSLSDEQRAQFENVVATC